MPEQKGLVNVNIEGIMFNKETGKIQIPITVILEVDPEEGRGLVNKLQEII